MVINKGDSLIDGKMRRIKNLTPESAGEISISSVPIVLPETTVGEIEKLLVSKIRNFENINYIYVTDDQGHLKGVLSIKELFKNPKDLLVKNFMVTDIVTVRPRTDRERVALLAIKHNLKNIAVVDKENIFLGVVPSDVILNVLHEEGIEDALRSEGILKTHYSAKEFIGAKASHHFRKRLPWLLIGLLGGLLAAVVISFFEQTLSEMIILAAFIPAVVYMADAVGAQTQTIFIRSMTLDQKISMKDYLVREISVSIWLALTLSILSLFLTFWWWKSFVVSFILSISFFLTIILAAFSGVFLPWLFSKMNFDPAISSGPLATVLRDISSVVIYFGTAFLILLFV